MRQFLHGLYIQTFVCVNGFGFVHGSLPLLAGSNFCEPNSPNLLRTSRLVTTNDVEEWRCCSRQGEDRLLNANDSCLLYPTQTGRHRFIAVTPSPSLDLVHGTVYHTSSLTAHHLVLLGNILRLFYSPCHSRARNTSRGLCKALKLTHLHFASRALILLIQTYKWMNEWMYCQQQT